jgi:hypothetical protein
MNAEEEGTAATAKRKWLRIIVAAGGAILVLVAIGALLLFKPVRSPATDGDETMANFADVNSADSELNAASVELNATEMNAAEMNATSDVDLPVAPSDWDYSDTFDQVRNATIYFASLESENTANFDFPYQGGSKLRLSVRWHPQYGQEVMLKISKGQFVCGVDDCSGTINFGSGPQIISLSEPTDNSSDTLFITDSSEIIDQLKKAKQVVVELPFYQEGNRQFTFEAKAALVWPPKGAEAKSLATDGNETSE